VLVGEVFQTDSCIAPVPQLCNRARAADAKHARLQMPLRSLILHGYLPRHLGYQ
jgi:hypothetical protein